MNRPWIKLTGPLDSLGKPLLMHCYLRGVWGSSPTDLYIVGDGGLILHSNDGESWEVKESGTRCNLLCVHGGQGDVYIAGGQAGSPPWGVLLKSSDRGETWSKIYEGE